MPLELPSEATRVTVLRHAEVAGRAHVLRGALDEPLAPGGQTRMERVVAELERQAPIDAVCASPLRRCLDFARPWAQARGLALAVAADFRERDFGAWEGLTHAEAARLAPEAHARYLASAGGEAPPGGEGLAALRARVETGWRAWLTDARGGHRLLVTHAGVMRVLLMDLLGLPPSHVYRLALPWAAHFQVSVLAGHPPVLLNLNPCAA